ncbi:MAG: type II secretion system protein GspD [Vulcanococcus sp.]
MRRSAGAVELVIQGTGPSPVLQQGSAGGAWTGQLRTASPTELRFGPQRIALPEAGLQSVSLNGAGANYQLQVVPMPGAPLARPVVSADGKNLVITFATAPQVSDQSARLDLRQPGTVPQPSFAPPLQPRAVAPPLGDMAVGSMVLRNQSFVNVSGPNVTLTLRNAPAKDALMAIAQLGGYGFVFVGDAPTASGGATAASGSDGTGRPVTISFRDESFARALNSVLLAAGLQGKREGNMILAGPNVLGKSFGPQMSKVYRLNQASASSAADYLASLGASITIVNVITNSVTQGTTQANQVAGGGASQQTTTQNITTTETYGGGTGPLRGLLGTTDSRLQTITLIGDSGMIAVAENFLRQLDLRQRQVALSVKILDVTLANDTSIANSFAFRSGNTYVVSENGELSAFFGGFRPSTSAVPVPNPGVAYPANQLYDFLNAQITSRNTKVLASPTLILSENPEPIAGGSAVAVGANSGSAALGTATIGRPFANESFVTVGTQVITNYAVQAGQNGAPNSCQPDFDTAGLTFGARVAKIDDNGFVTFTLSPSVSAITGSQDVSGCGPINILSVRRLDTGSVRVRDGQTLILTGVISDADSQSVTKWPILGDLPLIGQFFRGSSGTRQKNELVIMVTPRIVDDTQGGSYGYGYRPSSTEAQRMLNGSM